MRLTTDPEDVFELSSSPSLQVELTTALVPCGISAETATPALPGLEVDLLVDRPVQLNLLLLHYLRI